MQQQALLIQLSVLISTYGHVIHLQFTILEITSAWIRKIPTPVSWSQS